MMRMVRGMLTIALVAVLAAPCWAAKKDKDAKAAADAPKNEGKAAAEAPKKDIKGVDVPKYDGKPADMSKKVKIFVIMGQSNAVGMGKLATLEAAVKEGKKYPYLVDDKGEWVERQDVRYVRYMQGKGMLNNQWLTVKGVGNIGVEFGAGHIVGNFVDGPVMILKSCIGNRALGWDLLPPGSEPYEYEGKTIPGYRGTPDNPKGNGEIPAAGWYAGKNYDEDTGDVKKVIADLEKHYPGAKGCEVAGFFFWQGEKDCGNAAWANNYEKNLVQFIKSLRKDFNAPDAKFVLATLGEHAKGCGNKVFDAQMAVDGNSGKHPEFKGNVATVYSNPLSLGGSGNGHYGGNAETYMNVGEAMGQAMVDLLNSK